MATSAVYLCVTLLVVAVSQLVLRYVQRDRAVIHQRIVEEFGTGPDRTGVSRSLIKNPEALELSTAAEEYAYFGKDTVAAPVARARAPQAACAALLQRAALAMTPKQWLLIAAMCAAALGLVGICVAGWAGVVTGLAVGAAAPWAYLLWKARRREEAFLRQLPGAFELMARVIRAGQAVPQALQAVAETFDDPLAGEFTYCQHQQNFGLRPEVAFREMAQRCGILELRIFVMALAVQRHTGGNLAEVLERLAGVVRARLRVRQQMRTLTAEGRLQGLTLVVLPFVVFGLLFFINRRYAELLLARPRLVGATLGCMAVGVLWIRRIVRCEG